MGVTKSGRFAILTNYRRGAPADKKSRGQLVVSFLQSEASPAAFLAALVPDKELYDGFNLLCGTAEEVWYFSNRDPSGTPRRLDRGHVYGLSNSLLDTPWPKVVRGKTLLEEAKVSRGQEESLYAILQDTTPCADEDVQVTGWEPRIEKAMSCVFVPPFPSLGDRPFATRAQHILALTDTNELLFTERFRQDDGTWSEQRFEFIVGNASS